MSITDICQKRGEKRQKYIRGRGRLSSHACNWITNQNPYICILHMYILFALCVSIFIYFDWEPKKCVYLCLPKQLHSAHICLIVFMYFCFICVFVCRSRKQNLFVNPCKSFDYQSELPYISRLHT